MKLSTTGNKKKSVLSAYSSWSVIAELHSSRNPLEKLLENVDSEENKAQLEPSGSNVESTFINNLNLAAKENIVNNSEGNCNNYINKKKTI